MKIGVLKEIKDNEKRVAVTPGVISKIKKLGYEIFLVFKLISIMNNMWKVVLRFVQKKKFINAIYY